MLLPQSQMPTRAARGSGFDLLLREALREPSVLVPKTSLMGGRFVVERIMGSGGMGVVYEAFDNERNAMVALKMLTSFDASGVYRIKQEFRALADVVHPNLVALHELFCDQNQWFLTMELVAGKTLFDEPLETFDEGKQRSIFAQLAAGLEAIHDAGKLHRDLKPTNVMLTFDGRVVILDFGLVSDQEEGGVGQTIVDASIAGTPQYMAPEQAVAEPATPATDWYAFGVMLFEALTGRTPFEGKAHTLLLRKQQQDPPRPSTLRKGIPADLEQLCIQLLQRNPAVRPGFPEVIGVLGVPGRTGSGIEAPPPQDHIPFVGRVEELAALRDALEAAANGHSVVVFVHGISGVGKTALVEQFLRMLEREDRAAVLTGRCYERESVPFKAFDSLIDALSRFLRRLPDAEANRVLPREIHSLARLFPALERLEIVAKAPRPAVEIADPFEVRRRGFAALKEMLACIRERQPLVLHVDDLQWGDLDSALLLQEVLGPPDPPPLLFVGSYRRGEAQSSPFLLELLGSEKIANGPTQLRFLPLDGLREAEARRLVERLLDTESQDFGRLVDTIVRESEGVPYFIAELVRYVESKRCIEDLELNGKGALLQPLLMQRFGALPEPSKGLLEIISVAGRPIERELALRATGVVASDASVIDSLRFATLICTRGPRLTDAVETYHDRIREAVVSSLDPERLRQCHMRLAETLEASGRADAEWLLAQFLSAGRREKAGEYAVAAADQADRVKAFMRAAELYSQALELLNPNSDDGRYRELWTKLGDSLANAGRGAEAARAYLRPLSHSPPYVALDLKRQAAEQYLINGHLKEGLRLIRQVLATLGLRLARTSLCKFLSLLFWQVVVWVRGLEFREREKSQIPDDELIRVDTCWTVTKGLNMTDSVLGHAYGTRGLLLALQAGEPYRVARAMAVQATGFLFCGPRFRRWSLRYLQSAEALAKRIEHPCAIGYVEACYGCCRYFFGEWKLAFQASERATKIFREQSTGMAWEMASAQTFALYSLFFLGEFKLLALRVPQLLDEARQRGDLYAATNLRSSDSVVAWLVQDDVQQARQRLNEARADWPFEGFQAQHYYLFRAEYFLHFYTGDRSAPWIHTRKYWPALRRSKLLFVHKVRVDSLFLRAVSALLAVMDPRANRTKPERRALIASAEKDARRLLGEDFSSARPFAELIQAGVARARGNCDHAIALLGSAAASFERGDMAMYAAAARRQRGLMMGGDEGQKLIDDAERLMRRQTVKNPERLAAMLAPGFDGFEPRSPHTGSSG